MSLRANMPSGDAFNARDLNAQQVAASFIAPAQFALLLGDTHCVLEGPRGSGKTTLLKMLTPEAFSIWQKSNTDKSVSFIGIFVPADVRWAQQLSQRLQVNGIEPTAREGISQAVFSVGIALALIDTIEQCSQLHCQERLPKLCFALSRTQESEIAKALTTLWRLEAGVASFAGLKLALRQRQHSLGTLALELSAGRSLLDALKTHAYIGSSWLDNIVTALQTINELLERPDQRWAILLDELEIIPSDLLKTIVRAFRSTSDILRLKISLSPAGTDLIATGEPGAPTPNNDYRPIALWYEKREEARKFAETLFHNRLASLGALKSENADLASILGLSSTVGDPEEETDNTTNARGSISSAIARAFQRLYAKDASFRSMLDTKKIDVNSLPAKDSDTHGPFVRKIAPLVVFREREIERFDLGDKKARRKGGPRSAQPYCHYPNLLDLAEGNPRWILTLADSLYAKTRSTEATLDSIGAQTYVVDTFVAQFVSMLRVYPMRTASPSQPWAPYRFLEILGSALQASLYDGPFSSDPSLSFRIDDNAWSQFKDYIRVCIDLGALVIIRSNAPAPFNASEASGSLVNARVRISYRLAPEFRLPLKHTKEMNMSGPLKSSELLESKSSDAIVVQTTASERLPLRPAQGKLL